MRHKLSAFLHRERGMNAPTPFVTGNGKAEDKPRLRPRAEIKREVEHTDLFPGLWARGAPPTWCHQTPKISCQIRLLTRTIKWDSCIYLVAIPAGLREPRFS